MIVLNFLPEFIHPIEDEMKRSTIRCGKIKWTDGEDSCRCRAGDLLELKAKDGSLIKRVICSRASPVLIASGFQCVVLGGKELSAIQTEQLAWQEGFGSIEDMAAFFADAYKNDRRPFAGHHIEWGCG